MHHKLKPLLNRLDAAKEALEKQLMWCFHMTAQKHALDKVYFLPELVLEKDGEELPEDSEAYKEMDKLYDVFDNINPAGFFAFWDKDKGWH